MIDGSRPNNRITLSRSASHKALGGGDNCCIKNSLFVSQKTSSTSAIKSLATKPNNTITSTNTNADFKVSTSSLYSMAASFSPTASLYNNDNKYAKRRSQMESLRIQYRTHASSKRFVFMLVVTIMFTVLSFWMISNNISAGYAGSDEDVRSLQDLADSIRRVRIRRQQALNDTSVGDGGRKVDTDDLVRENEGLYPPHDIYPGMNRGGDKGDRGSMYDGDPWDGHDSSNTIGDGFDPPSTHRDQNDHRPSTSLHHSRPKDIRPPSDTSAYYKTSDHGGNRRERLQREERRWKRDEEGQMDEEDRLELVENKIRSSQELQVQKEVQAKRLDDKMDANIEALKEFSSHQQDLMGG